MAVEYFNSFGGFSAGIPPAPVIDTNGNLISNFNNLSGNVSANKVYANSYFYANGQAFTANAGGNTTELQFNNNGTLGGANNVTWNGSMLSLGNVTKVSISGGLNGYFLQTDGSGNLTWAAAGSGGNGSPGGSNTQVQFNDAGTFGGVTSFSFNKTTNTLDVPNALIDSISAGNVTATGNVSAEYFVGNGTYITGITTDIANYVSQPDQSNITSVGILTNLVVSGNIATSEYVSASNVQTSGTVTTGNIKVNTLANITGNLRAVGNINFSTSPNVNMGTLANIHISGGLNGYVLTTNGLGNLAWQEGGGGGGNGEPAGSNTQIQFNNNGSFGASPYFTFDNYTNTVQVGGNLIGNTFQMGAGVFKFSTSEVYFASTASMTTGQVLFSIPTADISGADFHIIGTDTSTGTRQSSKISSVVYNGTVQFTEYAGLYINGGVGTFEVDYAAGNIIVPPSLQLKVTPDSASSTIYKMLITIFSA